MIYFDYRSEGEVMSSPDVASTVPEVSPPADSTVVSAESHQALMSVEIDSELK